MAGKWLGLAQSMMRYLERRESNFGLGVSVISGVIQSEYLPFYYSRLLA